MQNACILMILLVIFLELSTGAQVSDVIRSWTSFLFFQGMLMSNLNTMSQWKT